MENLMSQMRESRTNLARHNVRVKDREDQSQDGPIKETKVGLEDDAGGVRGGCCHQVYLVSNKIKVELVSKLIILMVSEFT